MDDLFDQKVKQQIKEEAPLAERMRPEDFKDYFGQEELVGENSPLRRAIETDNLISLVFWGPPGSGKTTLAKIIAQKTKATFVEFSAATSGINDVKEAIKIARDRRKFQGKRTIIFIDEIHRFNKAQQDALLSYVEDGTIILIGATTENPSFGIISPLLSRSVVYVLKSLTPEALTKILLRALKNPDTGLGKYNTKITNKALERLINYADGDARVALNGLEFAIKFLANEGLKSIDEKKISEVLEKHALRYDKKGEEHYNLISAFIKSMRDSDPNGALYWLARIIDSGEDPRFIARRMIVFASEDIGNADPRALSVAISVANAVEFVGLPEAQINLAHGVTYLATAPKDNSSYKALMMAKNDAKRGSFGVPMHLRNAVTSLMKDLGYGKDYKYAHDYPDAKTGQTHFPKEIGEKKYYFPKNR